jgi:hypothetical protein
MPVVRIPQLTDNDCLPCCIAMVLNETRDTVLSWFEGRNYQEIPTMFEVLASKGYRVEEFDTVGKAGAARRIVSLVKNGQDEGHAVVMDEEHFIIDPRSKATGKKTLLDYFGSGYAPQRVFVITKMD